MTTKFDIASAIMDYEMGVVTTEEVLTLFSHLVRTGAAWTLQGHYGRVAAELIESGLLTRNGEVMWEMLEDE